ncbi:hypothetical protein C2S53_003883 [Perilla frutescens var. hirtella]|uniref:Fatty acyl-CoA reductase n=1 Tax=Perilla frutescens var. hirtella TaxID=608512 RepID=A0AAD4JJ87_PERFH|nr:hypothetical protein C2S53_003883 [Perilla frutescens var. hirtella]
MLLSHGSSLFQPPIERYEGEYCSKTNLKPFTNHLKRNGFTFTRKNDVVPYKRDRYSCFTRYYQPPATELLPPVTVDPDDVHAGIGILHFFEEKNIFVTGATGLLGKVLVEKMVRSTPVGKIYLLIKAKDREAAFHRMENEIIYSELFTCVKEKYGKGFVREKLIPIVGDICEPNLGMDSESIDVVRKNVHVIIQSAANTTFNERYDVIFNTNVIAPQRLMRFAKTCNKLQLFTHVSTAYVNEGEGIILEKPLIMGDNAEGVDVADEISLLLKSSTINLNSDYAATKFFKNLGQQRAKLYGWSTTYQLSKGMGEMVLNEIRGDIPLLIIRPSIVESCYKQPFPGWIQGYRMFDPLAISYGKGVLPACFGNPEAPLDLIPVDLVANTMIAAIAKHGSKSLAQSQPQPNVYHVASSVLNPLTYSDAFEYLYQYFNATPLVEPSNIANIKFFDNFDELSKYTKEEIFRCNRAVGEGRKVIRGCNAKVEYAQQLCKIYEFAGFFKAR